MTSGKRSRFLAWPLACGIALGLTGCGGPVEDTRPGQPVKTRQEAFKAMLRSFEPMGVMLRTDTYDAEKFARHAAELMQWRDTPWPLFGPDTHYPPSKAKATVWSQTEAFERERQAFVAALDELAAAVQRGEREAVRKAYFRVYDLCESCHKDFKER